MARAIDNTPQIRTIAINANVIKLGEGYLSYTIVGGVRVSGGRRNSAYEAISSLFQVLAGQSGDNSAAAIAIELLLAGVDINKLPELGTGS